jgi:hypothetical protein
VNSRAISDKPDSSIDTQQGRSSPGSGSVVPQAISSSLRVLLSAQAKAPPCCKSPKKLACRDVSLSFKAALVPKGRREEGQISCWTLQIAPPSYLLCVALTSSTPPDEAPPSFDLLPLNTILRPSCNLFLNLISTCSCISAIFDSQLF